MRRSRRGVLRSGNAVSTGALASMAFWDIDVLFLTQRGRPVAMLKSFDDDSHVKTRICQCEALKNGKGLHVAERLVLAKLKGQNKVLRKHGLWPHDDKFRLLIESMEFGSLVAARNRLNSVEGNSQGHTSVKYCAYFRRS